MIAELVRDALVCARRRGDLDYAVAARLRARALSTLNPMAAFRLWQHARYAQRRADYLDRYFLKYW